MEDNKIKICFEYFVEHLTKILKDIVAYDVDNMTVEQIEDEVDVLYMRYLMTLSSFTPSSKTCTMLAYEHLKNMLNSNQRLTKIENIVLHNQNKTLIQEIEHLKTDLSDVLFTEKVES